MFSFTGLARTWSKWCHLILISCASWSFHWQPLPFVKRIGSSLIPYEIGPKQTGLDQIAFATTYIPYFMNDLVNLLDQSHLRWISNNKTLFGACWGISMPLFLTLDRKKEKRKRKKRKVPSWRWKYLQQNLITAKSEESGEQYLLICVYILSVKGNKSYFPEPMMRRETK